jgi:molybdenum ABC transporter molybdate-binding protein
MDKISPLILAAGSLHLAMDEITLAHQAQGGATFKTKYGPSGKLRQKIEAGAKVDVFASASIDHTQALAQQKLLGPSEVFTHNDLCVIARPELNLSADNMLQVLSRPSVRVATSTPVSDPMGDYTWQFFKNADRKHAGFYQMLDAKARKLSGASVPATGERLPYITAFEDDKADAYMLYCTNAMITKKALPYLNVVRISDELNVRSDYGIAADLHWAVGKNFVRFIMQAPAQNILKKQGFD